jgi:ABC-type multidrug transport system ATPase subunit
MGEKEKIVSEGRGASGFDMNSSKKKGHLELIDIRRLAKGYGSRPIPQGPSTTVSDGGLSAFMGPNRSGKTLLEIILLGLRLYEKHRGGIR